MLWTCSRDGQSGMLQGHWHWVDCRRAAFVRFWVADRSDSWSVPAFGAKWIISGRVRAASGLRLVCGSSMVWPHLLHTSASVRRMPRQTHIMAQLWGAPHTAHRAMQRPHCPDSPRHPRRPPPGTLCPAHTFGARKGVLETVAAVRARRRHVSHLVTGPGSRHGLEPSLGHDRRGSRA